MLRRTAWHKFFWVVLVVCVLCAVFAQIQVSARHMLHRLRQRQGHRFLWREYPDGGD